MWLRYFYTEETVLESLLLLVIRLINGAAEIMIFLLFIRAILSWFPGVRLPEALGAFLFNVTEAVLSPVRALMFKIRAFRDLPIDLSFLAAYFLLHILQMLMSTLYRAIY